MEKREADIDVHKIKEQRESDTGVHKIMEQRESKVTNKAEK
jgi:hypothetical protein